MGDLTDKLSAAGQVAEDRARRAESVELRSLKAKNEELLRQLEESEKRADLREYLRDRSPVKALKPGKRCKGGQATAVLIASDWHVEEEVKPETVNGKNKFTLEIARQRSRQFWQKSLMLLEDARNLTRIDEVVPALLGDFFSGHIHEELVETNALAPLPAARFACDLLEEGLRLLLRDRRIKVIKVPTSHGNHGRATKKRRHATAADTSYEYNMYLTLAERFRHEPRIVWQIGTGYHNWLTIQGHRCRFHHGDSIRYAGGVGGITIPVNKAIAAWNKTEPAAYDFFGHYHTWTHDWRWICNGSLIGYNAFAIDIKAPYQPPVQTFAVIDAERGLTRALPVFCD